MNDLPQLSEKVDTILSDLDFLEKEASQIGGDEDLYKLGMDSVAFIQLVDAIEKAFNLDLMDLDIVDELSTKNGIIGFIKGCM